MKLFEPGSHKVPLFQTHLSLIISALPGISIMLIVIVHRHAPVIVVDAEGEPCVMRRLQINRGIRIIFRLLPLQTMKYFLDTKIKVGKKLIQVILNMPIVVVSEGG